MTELRALSAVPAGSQLLALRALTQASLSDILAAHPEAALVRRRGDPSATAALSALALRCAGLRPGDPWARLCEMPLMSVTRSGHRAHKWASRDWI